MPGINTSGAISLNDFHIEAGGTSGTTCSLNDTDIRELSAASGKSINSSSETNIDFGDFYGAKDLQMNLTGGSWTVTTGFGKAATTYQYYGYDPQPQFGSGGGSQSDDLLRGLDTDVYCMGLIHGPTQSFRRIYLSNVQSGVTFSAATGYRYVRLRTANSSGHDLLFDSNMCNPANGINITMTVKGVANTTVVYWILANNTIPSGTNFASYQSDLGKIILTNS